MKIGFCGTMSVGKTTLVKALQEIPELKNYKFATERSAYLNSLGIPLNHETTIEGQTIFLAERVSELMQPNIVTDRTIIDVMAFTKCAKKTSMEDNGVRETDLEYRNEIDVCIQNLLKKHRRFYTTIKGSTEERIEQILNIVKF